MSASKTVYLDYAAATPVDDEVLSAMLSYFKQSFYNPSALYGGARNVAHALSDARKRVAQSIGAKPSEITFVSGGTESDNLAITGVSQAYPGSTVIVSAVEHDAVLEPARKLLGTRIAPVDMHGRVDVEKLLAMIDDTTVLVSVMYVNNEVGTIQPIQEIVRGVARKRKERLESGNTRPLWVHTDACQAPLYLDISVASLGVDLMTLNGGKIFGPKQSAILYHRIGVAIEPLIAGGGQEFGLRSGTENVAGCVGFSIALTKAVTQRHQSVNTVHEVAEYFKNRLMETFPDCILNGHPKHRLSANVHVTFPGRDNERILFALDDMGVFASAGSACSASNEEASHVLLAMGVSEADARSSLRFSISKYTTKDEIDRTIESLKVAVNA